MISLAAISPEADSDEYWSRARQPLSCLVFLLPFLIVYEAGVLWFGDQAANSIRNGADSWMRSWLAIAGFQHALLLPALIAVALLVWHVWGQYPWRISFDTLVGMFAESLLFAFCLIVLGQLQDLVFQQWMPTATLSIGPGATVARLISFVGAGVYEEVMFRLCLLPLCYALFRILLLTEKWSAVLAIIGTSLLFSIAHYVGATGDQFSVFSFVFRSLAGLFFAVLFVLRGFGITVGCHAVYDILVGILLGSSA